MATTPAGAPVSYSAAEVNYLYDLQQGLLTNGITAPANASIRTALAGDRGLGVLSPNDRVTVVGHSLGGHLVQAFTQMFPMAVQGAYTFNAPGFGGTFAELVDRVLGPPGRLDINTSLVTNIFAEHGPDVTAGLGVMVGGTLRIFNEKSVLPIDDHFIEKLTDSLALYDLFQRLDPNMTLAGITDVLDASSNVSSRSLESALDALRTFVAAPGSVEPTEIGNRISFNERVLALQPDVAQLAAAGAHVESLARLPAGTIAERALSESGAAYRYALDRLLPYAVTGLDFGTRVTDHSLDIASPASGTGMSAEWVRDRSQLLSWLSVRNVLDAGNAVRRTDAGSTVDIDWLLEQGVSPEDIDALLDPRGSAVDFTWVSPSGTRENLRIVVNPAALPSQVSQVYFGGTAPDTFSGSGKDDRIYGANGDDQLQGLGGNDYLEGGVGNDLLEGGEGSDTLVGGPGDDVLDGGAGENRLVGGPGFDRYFIAADDAPDVIEDSDGLGAIFSQDVQLTGGTGTEGLYWNNAHTVYYTLAGSPSEGGMLSVNGEAVIPEFHNGDFGIQLAALDSAPPETPAPVAARHYYDSIISTEEYAITQEDHLIRDPYGSPFNDQFVAGPEVGPYFCGRAGDDIVQGGFGYALFYGGAGSDDLTSGNHGTALDSSWAWAMHRLIGGAGQDRLTGGDDADALYGDFHSVHLSVATNTPTFEIDGRTWYLPEDGSSGRMGRILPGFVNNFYTFDEQNYQPPFGRDPALFVRSEIGNPPPEQLAHFYDDELRGNGGDDYLIGGAGDDDLFGGPGNDYLAGDYPESAVPGWYGIDFGSASDLQPLFGQDGSDFLDGGEGNDRIEDYGGSHSYVVAGEGNDSVGIRLGANFRWPGDPAPSGYAFIDAGPGNDTVGAMVGETDIVAGDGNDFVRVTAVSGRVSGGTGDDTISPSGLYFDIDGGPGSDTISLAYTPYGYYGLGSYVVRNSEATAADFDSLELPRDSSSYGVFADGDDLVFELDPLLASTAIPDADVLNVTLVDWFAGDEYRMDRISFPISGETWSAQDAEDAIAGSPLVFLDVAAAGDLAIDPGEPEYADAVQIEPPPIELVNETPPADMPPPVAAAAVEGNAGSDSAAPEQTTATATPPSNAESSVASAELAAEAPSPSGSPSGALPESIAAVPAPMLSDDLVAMFDPPAAPVLKAPRRVEDTFADSEGVQANPVVAELAAAFFARNDPPPLTTSQWLEQWFPAGSRVALAERGTAEDLPESSTADSGDVQSGDSQMESEPTPDEVRLRYEEIDAFLVQETESDDLVASGPAWDFYRECGLAFSFSGDSAFGSVRGIAQLAGQTMRPLQGLREGFARLA